jgi:hypothetical protein
MLGEKHEGHGICAGFVFAVDGKNERAEQELEGEKGLEWIGVG